MSLIKTTEVEGDVAIGRHVTTGGNATIQGNTTVKKNLKVEGWLDARNIKGTDKGLFATVAKLREAHPRPHDGWHALVGSTLPAPVYIADGGEWVATGESAGNPTIDSQEYNEAFDEIRGDLREIETSVAQNTENIKTIRQTQTSHADQLGKLKEAIENAKAQADKGVSNASAAQSTADKAKETAEDAQGRAKRIEEIVGHPGGLATLNERGIVPESQLPEPTEQRVLSFAGIERGTPSILQSSVSGEGSVVFVEQFKTFAFRQGMKASLYANWSGADDYGPAVYATGRSPMAGRIYADSSTGVCYAWDGENLVNRGNEAYRAMQSQLDGYSIRYLTAAENEAMEEAGTFDPRTIYFIEEED